MQLMRSEVYVGWYEAANTLLVTLSVFPYAFGRAIFPLMARSAAESAQRVDTVYFSSMRLMIVLGLGTAVGVVCGAPLFVPALYGPAFLPAVAATQILAWTLLMIFITVPHARLLLAKFQQREAAVFLAASMATDVLLNLALVPGWGIIGTALARAGAATVFFMLNFAMVQKTVVSRSLSGIAFEVFHRIWHGHALQTVITQQFIHKTAVGL